MNLRETFELMENALKVEKEKSEALLSKCEDLENEIARLIEVAERTKIEREIEIDSLTEVSKKAKIEAQKAKEFKNSEYGFLIEELFKEPADALVKNTNIQSRRGMFLSFLLFLCALVATVYYSIETIESIKTQTEETMSQLSSVNLSLAETNEYLVYLNRAANENKELNTSLFENTTFSLSELSSNIEDFIATFGVEGTRGLETETPDYRIIKIDSKELSGRDVLRVLLTDETALKVSEGEKLLYYGVGKNGDLLEFIGQRPFTVVLGDATAAKISMNSSVVDISSQIRTDNSARIFIN